MVETGRCLEALLFFFWSMTPGAYPTSSGVPEN
jgi:hypothetical protein